MRIITKVQSYTEFRTKSVETACPDASNSVDQPHMITRVEEAMSKKQDKLIINIRLFPTMVIELYILCQQFAIDWWLCRCTRRCSTYVSNFFCKIIIVEM